MEEPEEYITLDHDTADGIFWVIHGALDSAVNGKPLGSDWAAAAAAALLLLARKLERGQEGGGADPRMN